MTRQSQDEKRRQREQEIMHAARMLIRERGYNNTSMDDLAERVGLSKPTLYQHFKTKEEIVAQAMLHSARKLEAFIVSLDTGSPLERLEKIFRHMIEDEAKYGFSTGMNSLMDMLRNHVEFWMLYQRVGTLLYALVHEAKIQGQIVATLDNGVIAGTMFAMLALLEHDNFERSTAEQQQQYVESMVQLYLQGIRA